MITYISDRAGEAPVLSVEPLSFPSPGAETRVQLLIGRYKNKHDKNLLGFNRFSS